MKKSAVFSLDCFLNPPTNTGIYKEHHTKTPLERNSSSTLPIRNSGKHREIPKSKSVSKLKQNILEYESQPQLELLTYNDNAITDELNAATTAFLKKIVTFQERAFKKDPNRARRKKRYVLGIHETKKYMLAKKVKFLVIASDIKVRDKEDLLYQSILELRTLAEENEIPCVFALKRSKIGNITLKYRQISCVGVLNFQSAEDEASAILDNLIRTNEENISNEDAEECEELLTILKGTGLECDKPDV